MHLWGWAGRRQGKHLIGFSWLKVAQQKIQKAVKSDLNSSSHGSNELLYTHALFVKVKYFKLHFTVYFFKKMKKKRGWNGKLNLVLLDSTQSSFNIHPSLKPPHH